MRRRLAAFLMLLTVHEVRVRAQPATDTSEIRIECASQREPFPVRPCGACKVSTVGGAGGVDLRVPRGSNVTFVSSHEGWTVTFKSAAPCERHSFDAAHPACKVTASSGTFHYRVVIKGCRKSELGQISIN